MIINRKCSCGKLHVTLDWSQVLDGGITDSGIWFNCGECRSTMLLPKGPADLVSQFTNHFSLLAHLRVETLDSTQVAYKVADNINMGGSYDQPYKT